MRKLQVPGDPHPCTNLGVRGSLLPRLLILICVVFPISTRLCSATQPTTAKNILLVFGGPGRRADTEEIVAVIESSVRARAQDKTNFYATYLDYEQVEDNRYSESMAETLRREYKGVKLDVVIADGLQETRLITQYRDKIFPGVPIVFSMINANELEDLKMLPRMTGVTLPSGIGGTIDLALHLHPDTNAVAVIQDTAGTPEQHWLKTTRSELLRYKHNVREIDLIGPPSRQMLERIDALPPHTVVLFQLAPRISAEPEIAAYDILAAAARRLPTYSAWDSLCFNHGCVGGAHHDWRKALQSTGEIAARVLNGEDPDDIPIVRETSLQVFVDWRQLRRWKIPESALPPGSEVLYREPTFWERDRNYILAAILVILAQALWIVALLWQRARKRTADAALKESEGRFQRMANTTPSLVWMCDQQGKVTYLNDRRIEFTGRNPKAGYDDAWTKYIHPDDVEAVLSTNALGLEQREKFSKQYRLRRKDGVYRSMFDVAAPRINGDGSFAGFIGSAADITDQILAQEALEKVSGQLIEAQERERSRIARDLHDDICQRLALVSMELEQANRNGFPPATKEHLEKIRQQCAEITGDIQSLSHQLHSSKLEYLGLVAAIRGMCRELAKKHEVSIEFAGHNVQRLPSDISLCLFRVAQEALHNGLKYSRSSQFSVELSATANEIRLEVKDAGLGFDVEKAKRDGGLGLVSMLERVHLVHGKLHVESAPGRGTKITAVVPVIHQIAAGLVDGTGSEAENGSLNAA